MQKPAELTALLWIVAGLGVKTAAEVGRGIGGTLWALANVIEAPADLYSIDREPAEDDMIDGVNVHVLVGDSATVELPEVVFDFVLIDADHSEQAVRADWHRYSRLVRPGGLVALHDIVIHPDGPGVDLLWADLVADTTLRTVSVLEDDGAPWAGLGLVFIEAG